jgi:hypothetical protein
MRVLTPSDLLVFDTNKVMYSAMEIYGGKTTLKTTTNSSSTSNSNNSNSNNSSSIDINDSTMMISNPLSANIHTDNTTSNPTNNTSNDNISSDECVVCLTESVQIILMPCRHMCVCDECLVHIDKCPTCRSPFDQHLKIHKEFKMMKDNTNSSYNTRSIYKDSSNL